MIRGSCCCGGVKFHITKAPDMMGTCHCSRCRKVGASAIVFVKKEDVVWEAGKELVQTYQPDPPFQYQRCFCGICGTSLGEILSDLDSFPIAANVFDDPLPLENSHHEFVGEKPAWYEICDGAAQSNGHPG